MTTEITTDPVLLAAMERMHVADMNGHPCKDFEALPETNPSYFARLKRIALAARSDMPGAACLSQSADGDKQAGLSVTDEERGAPAQPESRLLPADPGDTIRHQARGTKYKVIGPPLLDEELVILYRAPGGITWARRADEMTKDRFKVVCKAQPTPAPPITEVNATVETVTKGQQ